MTEEASYDENGELNTMEQYKYEYDKLNNWIVKTTYEENILDGLTEREIEYYE